VCSGNIHTFYRLSQLARPIAVVKLRQIRVDVVVYCSRFLPHLWHFCFLCSEGIVIDTESGRVWGEMPHWSEMEMPVPTNFPWIIEVNYRKSIRGIKGENCCEKLRTGNKFVFFSVSQATRTNENCVTLEGISVSWLWRRTRESNSSFHGNTNVGN
jgi:hypothetical protein